MPKDDKTVPLMPNSSRTAGPNVRQEGEVRCSVVVYEVDQKWDDLVAFYDAELTHRPGWTRKTHGKGFLWRGPYTEVMLLPIYQTQSELRVGTALDGKQLPDTGPITRGH
ncbi:MAG: hypothetical protein HY319_31390 [Armatimonadetes bacterium]|nr:hypothetical protein [Armatimonadota bacterium]